MAIRRRLGTRFVEQEPPPDPYKTAEEMEEHCCVPTPKVQCYERYIGPIYPDMEEAMKNAGITPRTDGVYDGTGAKNGRLTRIAWRPRKNPCGKVIERVKMDPKNCCDEVEPLAFDAAASVDILAPGTHGRVFFTGGKLPVVVKVRGVGFYLDGGKRDGLAYSRGFYIYAYEYACGPCHITLDDGCTTISFSIRCTEGEYVDCRLYWVSYYHSSSLSRILVGRASSGCWVDGLGLDPTTGWKAIVRVEARLLRWQHSTQSWVFDAYADGGYFGGTPAHPDFLTIVAGLSIATDVTEVEPGQVAPFPTYPPAADCTCPGMGVCRYIC